MPRFAMTIEYDGGAFAGSQSQRNGRSVQDELETALQRLCGERRRVHLAGRTDAGVHAIAQVGAVSLERAREPADLLRGWNALLPEDVALRALREVDERFDPRRDARWRTYRYRLAHGRPRPALDRQRVWWVRWRLDVAAMRTAATSLPGRRDFASFAARPARANAGSVRHLRRCTLEERGCELVVEMEADAFLPHQVRRTVGQLVEVGRGRAAPSRIEELLAEPCYGAAGPAAPAHGLCLVRIEYPAPWGDLGVACEDLQHEGG